MSLELGRRQLALAHLREWTANPRVITPDALERLKYAMTKDAAMLEARPLIALPDGTVIAGNMRLRAARELGWSTIACHVVDLDAATARAWALRDNSSYGSWEDEALAQLVADHAEASGDMALLGFADAELASLLRLAGAAGGSGSRGLGDPDEPPPDPPADAKSKLGELYLLGEHRLYVGDSSSDECVAALFADRAEADLIITDPPYGLDYQGKSIYGTAPREDATEQQWADYWTYRKGREKLMRRRSDGMEISGDQRTPDLATLIACSLGIAPLKAGGSFYVFAPTGASAPLFYEGMEAAELPVRHELVWVKERFALGLADYHYRHESILYGWKPGAAHFFVDDRTQDTVWEFAGPRASKSHPTAKPVDLLRKAVRNSSRRGQLVYDPFVGSGSTLIAAHAEQRICRCAEVDPRYADVVIARFEAYTDISAQRVTPEAVPA